MCLGQRFPERQRLGRCGGQVIEIQFKRESRPHTTCLETFANAAPATVLPNSLSSAFVHTREYPVIDNEYRNGESQRSAEAATSRREWNLTKRLTPAQLAALRTFYDARNGTHEPFYFYDPYETSPKFTYDPTEWRYRQIHVRFNTDWNQSVTPGRSDVQLELIELA